MLQKFITRLLIYFSETQVQDLCNTSLECWSGIGLMAHRLAQSFGSVSSSLLLLLIQIVSQSLGKMLVWVMSLFSTAALKNWRS